MDPLVSQVVSILGATGKMEWCYIPSKATLLGEQRLRFLAPPSHMPIPCPIRIYSQVPSMYTYEWTHLYFVQMDACAQLDSK